MDLIAGRFTLLRWESSDSLQAVKATDPDAKVDVDLPGHKVRVETKASREAIAAALSEAGYQPD